MCFVCEYRIRWRVCRFSTWWQYMALRVWYTTKVIGILPGTGKTNPSLTPRMFGLKYGSENTMKTCYADCCRVYGRMNRARHITKNDVSFTVWLILNTLPAKNVLKLLYWDCNAKMYSGMVVMELKSIGVVLFLSKMCFVSIYRKVSACVLLYRYACILE